MSMQPEQGINRELGLGEAISKTFQVFRQDFAKYFVLYAVVGIIVQVATKLAQQAFVAPMLPVNPTPQQVSNFFSGLFGALFLLIGVIFVVNIIFSTIAQGSAITLASERITKRQASLGASIRFAASKLLSIWAVSIIIGIIVFLGILALIVPGIILAIMYSLALPVLLIEKKGFSKSRRRTLQLVTHGGAKTSETFLALEIIVITASLIFGAIPTPFGTAGPIVNGFPTPLSQPLFPILLAVYYY